jgi:hypothetical protein
MIPCVSFMILHAVVPLGLVIKELTSGVVVVLFAHLCVSWEDYLGC